MALSYSQRRKETKKQDALRAEKEQERQRLFQAAAEKDAAGLAVIQAQAKTRAREMDRAMGVTPQYSQSGEETRFVPMPGFGDQAANSFPDATGLLRGERPGQAVMLPTAERRQAVMLPIAEGRQAVMLPTFKRRGEVARPGKEAERIRGQTGRRRPYLEGRDTAAPVIPYAAGEQARRGAEAPKRTTPDEPQPSFFQRAADTVAGGLKGSGASLTNLLGTAYELGQGGRDRENRERLEEYARELEYAQRNLDSALAAVEKDPEDWRRGDLPSLYAVRDAALRKYEALRTAMGSAAQERSAGETYKMADRLQQSSARDIAQAKDGLGIAGQIAVDAGACMTQMAGDAVGGLITGNGMLPFAMRAFGGGAQQARQDGADLEGQAAYGALSAAKEVFTEKMFNIALPFSRIYGAGSMDEGIKRAIQTAVGKLAKTELGKKALEGLMTMAASGVTEGLEELIGDWMEWKLPLIYGGETDSAGETLAQSLYDFAVGATVGLVGDAAHIGQYGSGEADTHTGDRIRAGYIRMLKALRNEKRLAELVAAYRKSTGDNGLIEETAAGRRMESAAPGAGIAGLLEQAAPEERGEGGPEQWGETTVPEGITPGRPFDSKEATSSALKRLEKSKGLSDNINILRYYIKDTDFVAHRELRGPIAYNVELDVIGYNPDKAFPDGVDRDGVIFHEIAHRIATRMFGGLRDAPAWQAAIDATAAIVEARHDEIQAWFLPGGKYRYNAFLSDIFSALSKGRIVTLYSHSKEAWSKEGVCSNEIFADIVAIDALEGERDELLDPLYEAFKNIIEGGIV